ncbi:MAG: transglycosylase SLT domain-containing protein [Allosphingosinicella sp.]
MFPRVLPSIALALMEIESSFRPDAHAPPLPKKATAAAVAGGEIRPSSGAWGLLQVLQPTAADMVAKLKNRHRAGVLEEDVAGVLEKWDPKQPKCLTDAELGSLIGICYLDHLAERFGGSLVKLAIAYHNGAGFLREFLHAGKLIPEDLPPKGAEYLRRAEKAWAKYSDGDPVIRPEAEPVA